MSRHAPSRPGLATLAGVVGGAGALTAYLAATAASERTQRRWRRTNHAGRPVTLLEGPAYAVGAAAGAALAGPAGVVAILGAGAFGAADDLVGDASSKGLKGHLGALRRGQVTTGAAKILGIGVTALAAVALNDRRDAGPERRGLLRGGGLDLLLGAGVVAGSANLANLLDLRPGRALKVVLLTGLPLAATGRVEAGAATGAALALLGPDLAGEAMLGDTGANAAGALVGLAAARHLSRRGRLACLAGLTALTVVSEKVSFTAVIDATPGLRELDALGRRR